MRTNWFHVLVAIAAEDRHGSAIARDVLEQTEGGLRLWPATLYRTLDDMVEAGLIVECSGEERPARERGRRRFYGITPAGKAELSAAVNRMATLADLGRRRLGDAAS